MAQLRLTPIYCIDANSLINLGLRYPKSMKIFLPIWEKIEEMIENNDLISHIEVRREIEIRNDKTARWCKQNKKMFKNVDEEQLNHFEKVREKYDPEYWNKEINRLGAWADPWLIALSISYKAIIVTDENKTKPNRIPVIAQQFGIRSLNLLEFFKEIGIK